MPSPASRSRWTGTVRVAGGQSGLRLSGRSGSAQPALEVAVADIAIRQRDLAVATPIEQATDRSAAAGQADRTAGPLDVHRCVVVQLVSGPAGNHLPGRLLTSGDPSRLAELER